MIPLARNLHTKKLMAQFSFDKWLELKRQWKNLAYIQLEDKENSWPKKINFQVCVVTHVSVENFQFAISLNLRCFLECSCLMTYRRL